MKMDSFLASTSLIDCGGHVSHTLTLQIDGTVEVQARNGVTVLLDPVRRCCLTPGVEVPDQLMDLAASLRP